MENEDEPEWALVMPFVLCQSQGGPHEDNAFTSGWRMGMLEMSLKLASIFTEIEPSVMIAPPNEEKQIDLMAMRFGFLLGVEPYDEDWSMYRFERVASA